jgi:hypothetical protein
LRNKSKYDINILFFCVGTAFAGGGGGQWAGTVHISLFNELYMHIIRLDTCMAQSFIFSLHTYKKENNPTPRVLSGVESFQSTKVVKLRLTLPGSYMYALTTLDAKNNAHETAVYRAYSDLVVKR